MYQAGPRCTYLFDRLPAVGDLEDIVMSGEENVKPLNVDRFDFRAFLAFHFITQ